jgi:phosphatidate cytidylyltransferase
MPKKVFTTVTISATLALACTMGHFYFCLLTFIMGTKLYFEITGIRKKQEMEEKVGLSVLILEIMVYLTSCYIFIPVLVVPRYLMETQIKEPQHWVYDAFYNYHPLFAFFMCITCFLFFVTQLKKGFYRYQLRIFILSLMGGIFGFAGTLLACKNAYKGLFWVVLPHTAMMINDSAAFLIGITSYGRTRIIKVSQHRTLEGFVVGLISSSIWCYFACFHLV